MMKAIIAAVLLVTAALWLQPSHGQTQLASQLVGQWQATLTGGIVEELSLEPLGANGEGRFSDRKTASSRVLEQFAGFWRIRTNPMLGPQSRTQLQLGWVDPSWGRKELSLAIRGVSSDTLSLGSVFVDSQTTHFRRVGR